jgi:hypothetical protein
MVSCEMSASTKSEKFWNCAALAFGLLRLDGSAKTVLGGILGVRNNFFFWSKSIDKDYDTNKSILHTQSQSP